MGCGQSKINLYPRRNKNNKRNRAKKSGAVDKDTDDEEENTSDPAPEEPDEEADDTQQHVLPIADHQPAFQRCKSFDIVTTAKAEPRSQKQAGVLSVIIHQPAFEVSDSQQNFFKMLDEKIEQGKDYDSTSETELQIEQERKRNLIEQWNSMSQSTQSSISQCSPPSPTRQRLTRSLSKASERQCAPSTSKCYKQESPLSKRSHSAQIHEPRPSTSDCEPNKSPVKRSQSAGPNWKSNPKVAPIPKPENKDEAVAGCSKDSQITYNPTFQNSSPAHSTKAQPYKAQIMTYPQSQQVTPASPSKYIAPPDEYQDPDVTMTVTQVTAQSQIYYIHGNNTAPDIAQQRQQTAIHLQQYVAMKQAQQQMFTSYMQRAPPALPGEYSNTPRMYEGEELAAQYGHPGLRPHSAPNRQGFQEVTHVNMPMWSPLPPVMTGPWAGGMVPPEMQYYPQSQFVSMFRGANSAGSAGTLTRYHKKDGPERSMQSISMVRGKPVGQVVTVGGQELAVSSTVSDSPSPASVSTDSGVSPGTSAPSSKSSFSTTPPTTSANDTFDPKPKKKTTKRTLKVSKSLDA